MRKMFDLDQEIKGAKRIGIAGHIRPDGDCVGSCLGLGLYLRENYPELEAVDIHLESVPEKFRVLEGTERPSVPPTRRKPTMCSFLWTAEISDGWEMPQNILRPREK